VQERRADGGASGPGNVRRLHQLLHHVVADAAWSDDALLKQARSHVLAAMTRKHTLAAWIIDDMGMTRGSARREVILLESHTRQYGGQLGKQENRRVSVSVSLATEEASIPATYQLYLPEIQGNDPEGRKQAGVPKEVRFQTKLDIALGQIFVLWRTRRYRVAWCWPMPPMATTTAFAMGLVSMGLSYAVGIQFSAMF